MVTELDRPSNPGSHYHRGMNGTHWYLYTKAWVFPEKKGDSEYPPIGFRKQFNGDLYVFSHDALFGSSFTVFHKTYENNIGIVTPREMSIEEIVDFLGKAKAELGENAHTILKKAEEYLVTLKAKLPQSEAKEAQSLWG